MNLNEMAAEIALREGKLKSVSVAQVKEILRIVCQMIFTDPKLLVSMYRNGEKQCVPSGKVGKQFRNIKV